MAEPDVEQTGAAAPEGSEPSGGRVEVGLDEAISIAILFLKSQRLEEAERVFRAVLSAVPDHPVALHFAGVLAHQQGRSAEALALIGRSLEADSGQADWHSNLGIVLKAERRFDDAIAAFRRAIELDPTHANAQNNLGTVFKTLDRLNEAEAAYREAIRLNPEYAEAYHNLGNLLLNRRRVLEGLECLNKAVVLCPESRETRRLLALAHCALGERDKAADIYRRWLQEEPDNATARHMLAACSGEAVPERAADDYVESLFDNFASTFDLKLERLGYRAPQLVAAMLEDAGLRKTGGLDVLDAGCGTGLCGPLVREYARRLAGVDLSDRMLAEARKRNVYDELHKGELTRFLQDAPGAFDVVVSADTLVYFGSLADVVAAAAAALRPGGWLVFTLEHATAEGAAPEYVLNTHGRYAHGREYVERLLRDAGLRPTTVAAELRMEGGRPVAGLVVRARRDVAEPGPRGPAHVGPGL